MSSTINLLAFLKKYWVIFASSEVKYICDIYDWDGKGEIDLFFLGDVMYALGLNVTKKVCVMQGQTDEEGKKFAKYDEVVEKVKAAVATPDSQVINNFLKVLWFGWKLLISCFWVTDI